MVFVFDLDDTICETDKYSEKYILNFFSAHNLPYKQIAKNVRFAEKNFDWDKETAMEWYKKYGDEMMLKFPYKKHSMEFLQNIHQKGHKIVIATARATDWHENPKEITLKWLADNNIPYDKLYVGRFDKEKICKEENSDVFVDDDLNIVQNVANCFADNPNKKVFLSTTLYNQNLDTPKNVIRIHDFNEILNYIQI